MVPRAKFVKSPEHFTSIAPEPRIYNIIPGIPVTIMLEFDKNVRRFDDTGFGIRYEDSGDGWNSTSAEHIFEVQNDPEREHSYIDRYQILDLDINFPDNATVSFQIKNKSTFDIFSRFYYTPISYKFGLSDTSYTWDEAIRWRFITRSPNYLTDSNTEEAKQIITDILSLYTLGQIAKQLLQYVKGRIQQREDGEEIIEQTNIDDYISND